MPERDWRKNLMLAATCAFSHVDPMRLLCEDAPADEYAPEGRRFAETFDIDRPLLEQIREVHEHMFGGIKIKEEDARRIARLISQYIFQFGVRVADDAEVWNRA